jgi:putative FmdB family regulatory protein
MPIYEYKCPNGHLLEVFHGMTEPGPQQCETCGASPLQRVLHPVAVHYKGSGFYSTDYGKGGRKAAKDSGSSDSSSSSSSDSSPSPSSSDSSSSSSDGGSSSTPSSGD